MICHVQTENLFLVQDSGVDSSRVYKTSSGVERSVCESVAE